MKILKIQTGSTLLLRGSVVVLGLFVLMLCALILSAIATEWTSEFPGVVHLQWPIFIWLSLTTLPFYAALYQSFKLLNYIDNGTAFSKLSVKTLRNIKYCAGTLSLIYVAGLPFLYAVADVTDAPGILAMGLIITFAAFSIGIFAALLERLLGDAVTLKNENDLTV